MASIPPSIPSAASMPGHYRRDPRLSGPSLVSKASIQSLNSVDRFAEYEPDDVWKATIRANIKGSIDVMKQEAADAYSQKLKGISDLRERDVAEADYRSVLMSLDRMGQDEFKDQVNVERYRRMWDAGKELPPAIIERLQVEEKIRYKSVVEGTSPTDDTSELHNAGSTTSTSSSGDDTPRRRANEETEEIGITSSFSPEPLQGSSSASAFSEARGRQQAEKTQREAGKASRKGTEVEKKAEEVGAKEAELKRKEDEVEMREAEVRRKEEEVAKREAEMLAREEQLKQREAELAKKAKGADADARRRAEDEERKRAEELRKYEEEFFGFAVPQQPDSPPQGLSSASASADADARRRAEDEERKRAEELRKYEDEFFGFSIPPMSQQPSSSPRGLSSASASAAAAAQKSKPRKESPVEPPGAQTSSASTSSTTFNSRASGPTPGWKSWHNQSTPVPAPSSESSLSHASAARAAPTARLPPSSHRSRQI